MLAGVAEDALDTAQDRQTHSRPGNQPGLRVSLAPCLVWRATRRNGNFTASLQRTRPTNGEKKPPWLVLVAQSQGGVSEEARLAAGLPVSEAPCKQPLSLC